MSIFSQLCFIADVTVLKLIVGKVLICPKENL